jgi:glycosyltransferase involved in cell wall biosynthesis
LTTPTLSVIMGNYNHAHYLVESIPAILNQSFRPKELIIIDDASTDNSVEIIEGFAKKDPVVRFYKNDVNLGNAPTYIKALEKVTGDYFNITAADDLVLPGLFEKSMAMLAKYPHAGLCSAISRQIDGDGNELVASPEPPYISKVPCYLSPEKALKYSLEGEGWCMPSTAIWRQSAVLESGGIPWEAGEFADGFLVPLISLNYGACFIPEPLGLYRVLSDSRASQFRKDPQALKERVDHIAELMRSAAYTNKFPESYVVAFQNQMLYQQGAMALQNLQESVSECHTYIEKTVLNFSLFDKFVLRVNKILGGIQHRVLKLYLYGKLRRLSWLMVRRVFLRTMKKFGTRQE